MRAGGSKGSSPWTLTTISSPAPAATRRDLRDAVRAGRMLGAGHFDDRTCRAAGVVDARVVRRDDDLRGTGAQRQAVDMQDHRQARDREERLTRQAGGCVPRGDDDPEDRQRPVSASSSARGAALRPAA